MARAINREKLNKLKTANQHFDKVYGVVGTETRSTFEFESTMLYVGELIKENRVKQDLTQEELAQRTGLKRSYISKIEKGDTDMRLSNFIKILKGLDLNIFNIKDITSKLEEATA